MKNSQRQNKYNKSPIDKDRIAALTKPNPHAHVIYLREQELKRLTIEKKESTRIIDNPQFYSADQLRAARKRKKNVVARIKEINIELDILRDDSA